MILGVSPQITSYTFSDASYDVKKMVTYLRENKVPSLMKTVHLLHLKIPLAKATKNSVAAG